MMDNTKFTKGSEWKTRGGWRAMVPKGDKDFIYVWHDQDFKTHTHNLEGARFIKEDGHQLYDLIEPWKEPLNGTFWVNVYNKDKAVFPSKELADRCSFAYGKRIALKKVTWREGDEE